MRPLMLAAAVVPLLGLSPARAGARQDARPKGAVVVATVAYRLGARLILLAADGAAIETYQTLHVGRPTRLVIVRRGKQSVEHWRDWQEVGTITVRRKLHDRCWGAAVAKEIPPEGRDGRPIAGLRPGDIVYRLPDTPAGRR